MSTKLNSVADATVRQLLGTVALNSGAVAEGTSAGKIKTTANVVHIIDGVFKLHTATDDLSITDGHDKLLSGYSALFAVGVDGASVATAMGQVFKPEGSKFRGYKTNKDKDGAVTGYTQETALTDYNCAFAPNVPAGYALIAVIKVVASADFTPGTTDLGSQETVTDCCAIPAATNL